MLIAILVLLVIVMTVPIIVIFLMGKVESGTGNYTPKSEYDDPNRYKRG